MVRSWSYQIDSETDLVITGGVLTSSCGSIGRNNVTVSCYYYKIYFDPEADIALGFLLENKKYNSGYELSDFLVSIDSIEKVTGLDFFASLPEPVESQIEDDVSPKVLSFTDLSTQSTKTESSKVGQAVQCRGIAKSTGARCRNKTKNANSYCHYHQDQVGQKGSSTPAKSSVCPGRCKATTQKGIQCKRKASAGSSYCWQHD